MGKLRFTKRAICSLREQQSGKSNGDNALPIGSTSSWYLRAMSGLKDEVLLFDGIGIIQWTTASIQEKLKDITGKHCSYLCQRGIIPSEGCPINAVLSGAPPDPRVTEIEAPDGSLSYVETTVHVRYDKHAHRVETIVLVQKDVTSRVVSERALESLSEKLTTVERALERKTSALNEILTRIHQEKQETAAYVRRNIEQAIFPVLSRLRHRLRDADQAYVDTLLTLLRDIASPFVDQLESRFGRFTPRELEISNLVRSGLSSKEIAALLNRSEGTVRQQRKQIRKKLGIAGDSTNLSLFLRSMETNVSGTVVDETSDPRHRIFSSD